jgi:thiol-disulfide isomerase/thioredoxin
MGKTLIGVYFSAQWVRIHYFMRSFSIYHFIYPKCPPCRSFTPIMLEFYSKCKQEGKDIEIILVSSDADQDIFNSHFEGMPWLAIPFSNTKIIEQIGEKFAVRGVPALVILNSNGEVVDGAGRQSVTNARGNVGQVWNQWCK